MSWVCIIWLYQNICHAMLLFCLILTILPLGHVFSSSSLNFYLNFLYLYHSPPLIYFRSIFSLSLENDAKWPSRVDVTLNQNTTPEILSWLFHPWVLETATVANWDVSTYHARDKFNRRQTDDFVFLFFLENRIWHIMQIVSELVWNV